jgi:hypothetical protein
MDVLEEESVHARIGLPNLRQVIICFNTRVILLMFPSERIIYINGPSIYRTNVNMAQMFKTVNKGTKNSRMSQPHEKREEAPAGEPS